MIIVPTIYALTNTNYIAGFGDGIVTVLGKPASRKIWLFNAETLAVESVTISQESGRYVFSNLDTKKEYLVMVRDYKKELEPFAWDCVKPSLGLTLDMLQEK